MPKTYESPLTSADVDDLQRMARKGNARAFDYNLAPMYCAVDGGDASQPDGFLFVCWPALNPAAARAAAALFEALQQIAWHEFGSVLRATADLDEPEP